MSLSATGEEGAQHEDGGPHGLHQVVGGLGILAAGAGQLRGQLEAVGVGLQSDLPSAIRAMTRIDHALEPRLEYADTYTRTYEAYTALYPATAAVLRPLSGARP